MVDPAEPPRHAYLAEVAEPFMIDNQRMPSERTTLRAR